jgi:MFS family permease
VLKRALNFFALNKPMAAMLGMVVFLGLGERIAERFVPVYLLAIGASSLVPGFVNGMNNLLSALYSYPAGWLTDRIGYKKSLAIFNAFAALGFALVAIFPSWISVVVGSAFFLSWTALSLPATMSLVSAVLPSNKHAMGVSMHSLVRRIPMALGPILGGTLIGAYGMVNGVRIAFGISFVLAIVALVAQQFLIEESAPAKKEATAHTKGFWNIVAALPRELRVLLGADILIRFCEQIPYAYMAIWVMENASGAKISASQFGTLTFVEMMVALLVYIPVAWLADKGYKKLIVTITFVNFTLFPAALYFARTFEWLILAFVIRGLKEFGEPTRKSLILDMAPNEQKAASFGAYYLLRDVVVSVAAFGSGYLWAISPAISFTVATVFGVMGTLIFAIWGRTKIGDIR